MRSDSPGYHTLLAVFEWESMLHPYQIYSDSLKIKTETNFGKFAHLQGKRSDLVI